MTDDPTEAESDEGPMPRGAGAHVPRLHRRYRTYPPFFLVSFVIAALYYMVLAPGWRPGDDNATPRWRAITNFVLLSGAAAAGALAYIFGAS